jgi:outer membrane protein assembly factor BamB
MRTFLAIAMSLSCCLAKAGDWPQIHGPTRNGQVQDEQLSKMPSLDVAWSARVGAGYAGPAIADGRVVIFHRIGDQEHLEALDLKTGKSLWKAEFAASYRGGIDPDIGPRCVPTIDNGRVFAFGAAGEMHCVKLTTGEKLWSRDLATDYDGPELLGYFGAGSSPIVAGGHLWLNLGGKDAGLIALDPVTGKTQYHGTTERASYSSPTLAKINGRESLIFVTRLNCVGVDPKTGDPQFSFPFGKRGPTVNAATPLVFDNKLFVSASYGVGAKLMTFAKSEPTPVWENDESMSSQYTTCVHHNGYLYGAAGREDVGDATLRCIDANTGEVKWDEEAFGIAHVILVKNQLVVVRQRGEVMIAAASPTGFKPTAKASVTTSKIRALPAFAQGKLLVRTVADGAEGQLICIGL